MNEINCGRCGIKADCRIIVGLLNVPENYHGNQGEWIPNVPRKHGKPEHIAAQRRRVCAECYIVIHREYIERLKEKQPCEP